MDKPWSLASIVADLEHYIEIAEKENVVIAGLCLRMARMEFLMKIHGVTSEEFEALCERIEIAVTNRAI